MLEVEFRKRCDPFRIADSVAGGTDRYSVLVSAEGSGGLSMSGTQVLARLQQDRVLNESAQHQRFAVLTHQTPGGWRSIKGKFAPGEHGSGIHFLVPWPGGNCRMPLPEPGDSIGCTFRVGHKKCMFESTVDRTRRNDADGSIVLRWPSQLHQLQRRVFERSAPPSGTIIAVRFWHARPGEQVDSQERDVRHGQLLDLSAGGMRIQVSRPEEIEDGALYCCTFSAKQGKPPFLVDALLRHREAVEHNRASLGFQFIGLDATADGRRTLDRLARLVSYFQRATARHRN